MQQHLHGSRMVRCPSESINKEPLSIPCNKKRSAAELSMKASPIHSGVNKRQAKHSLQLLRKNKKTKRSVRFAGATGDKTIVCPVVQEQDRTNVWYQNHEFYRIRNEILASLQVFAGLFKGTCDGSDSFVDMSQHCLRGIETAVSAELNLARQQRIQQTKHVVFYQQTLHKMAGVNDPDTIGVLASRAAREAHEAAASAGLLDWKALSD